LRSFHEKFNRDIIGSFRQLQDEGYIEIITSAATHGYLPLLSTDSAVRAQVEIGIRTYERLFGCKPKGFWLPECAYRPAYIDDKEVIRKGIEAIPADYDIKVFFTETHTVTGGQPVGVAAGDVIGPYGNINRRYVIPDNTIHPARDTTTFEVYYVSDSTAGEDANSHSGVAVLGRNARTGEQVWSADWGYPGDFDYREFHRKAGTSGLQYWRVTGDPVDLNDKELYHPEWASFKVEQHAENFSHIVGDLLREYYEQNDGRPGIVMASYDTELFGHWWFEGVEWLGAVLRHLSEYKEIDVLAASDIIEKYPPEKALQLPESSWGAGGRHFTWDNGETHWMWEPIHNAEARMEQLANTHTDTDDASEKVLAQAARELLLMQSSDWSFLVTTNQAKAYAIQRFN
ncbi:MAG: 1,4-alpha-glucan branching protein domain-containing protein, partial [Chloroflexota bacterium]